MQSPTDEQHIAVKNVMRRGLSLTQGWFASCTIKIRYFAGNTRHPADVLVQSRGSYHTFNSCIVSAESTATTPGKPPGKYKIDITLSNQTHLVFKLFRGDIWPMRYVY
eukprot:GHVS01084553.1.p1 GENE.GHVS01084553.1~~GHVS01084553.1.p1  ORF type:complete len:127 (+),score=0.35 GHVS01084553.1:60-383(+)